MLGIQGTKQRIGKQRPKHRHMDPSEDAKPEIEDFAPRTPKLDTRDESRDPRDEAKQVMNTEMIKNIEPVWENETKVRKQGAKRKHMGHIDDTKVRHGKRASRTTECDLGN